jgi:hypothetical protein
MKNKIDILIIFLSVLVVIVLFRSLMSMNSITGLKSIKNYKARSLENTMNIKPNAQMPNGDSVYVCGDKKYSIPSMWPNGYNVYKGRPYQSIVLPPNRKDKKNVLTVPRTSDVLLYIMGLKPNSKYIFMIADIGNFIPLQLMSNREGILFLSDTTPFPIYKYPATMTLIGSPDEDMTTGSNITGVVTLSGDKEYDFDNQSRVMENNTIILECNKLIKGVYQQLTNDEKSRN